MPTANMELQSKCRKHTKTFSLLRRDTRHSAKVRERASVLLAREQFFLPASESLFKKLEQLSQRSGVSRGVAFEDWLTAMVCALAAETKEGEYLAMVERHKAGKPGRRGCDLMAEMFGELVAAMDKTDADIIGDLFVGAISYGEAGQYFTPESLTRLMAQVTIDPDARPDCSKPIYVNDPCCGTGRMLLEAATINPHAELVGQDVDPRCARMTALNLGLRGRYGWVVCGNSLTGDTSFAYRVGSYFHESPNGLRRGVIRDVPPEDTPVPVIASRLRNKAAELFAEEPAAPRAAEVTRPTIIEVPPWLARLEPGLAALEGQRSPPSEPARPQIEPPPAATEPAVELPALSEPPPTSQRRLF